MIPGPAVDRTRAQLEAYHRFRQMAQELISISERICDHHLRHPEPGAGSEKKSLIAALLPVEILGDVELPLGRQSRDELDLEALATAVRRQAPHWAAQAVQRRLNADPSDGGLSRLSRGCGQLARYIGCRSKAFVSILGPLVVERPYFHCSGCGHGFCPRDRQLGLTYTHLSPAVTRRIATVGAMGSFAEGSHTPLPSVSAHFPRRHDGNDASLRARGW